MKLLASSNTWYADGNFGLAPKNFLQLYVIRIGKYNEFFTVLFCLLEKKTQSIYEIMFHAILSVCEKNNLFPDPLYLKVDFEKALINAAKNVLGEHLTINGCFYHLCQSTHRKLAELGLKKRYQDDDNFNNFCGMLDGLAFLPLTRLNEGIEYLKLNIPLGAEDLFNYFDETYVSGTLRRVNKQNVSSLTVRRFPAIFPPETWNVHQTTIQNNQRTNNVCESWNNRFRHLVGVQHPSIWTLINKIKNELSADRAKLALQTVGESKTKCSKSKTAQKRLKTLCERLNSNEIEVDMFLKKISFNLRKRL